MYHYQQPLAYKIAKDRMDGLLSQYQQLRNQRVAAYPEVQLNDADTIDLPVDPYVEPTDDTYPAQQVPVENEPAFYELEPQEPIADEPTHVVPAVASTLTPSKKKVQIDSAEEVEQAGRRNPATNSAGPNAYFPINFGGVNSGAVAVANSYSTGEGGSSISTATAYGRPVNAEFLQLKRRPAKSRHY
ncbi:uncharacterized protein LOC134215281 isoform X2 [Armigeres subalbatus]